MRRAKFSDKQLKARILDLLSRNKRLPASRISGALGIGYYKTNRLLLQLKLKDHVICEEETTAKYWRLKINV